MNAIRLFSAVLISTVLVWLGASFTMTAEPAPYMIPETTISVENRGEGLRLPVRATHPDSHRLGIKARPPGLPALPEERSEASAVETFILDLAQATMPESPGR